MGPVTTMLVSNGCILFVLLSHENDNEDDNNGESSYNANDDPCNSTAG